MNAREGLFQVEQVGQILILSPTRDLNTLELSTPDETLDDTLQQLDSLVFRHLLLDLAGADSCGSTALAFFTRLWKRVRNAHGDMALCNVSPHGQEVLELTCLNRLWSICVTRDEAIEHLQAE